MNMPLKTDCTADVVLSVEHITKTYESVVALDDVSLTFQRGTVHAIAGENGAGKSTLIKVISGYTNPDEGKLTIDDESFTAVMPRHAIDLGVEVIYQELSLVPELSVTDNVFMGNFIGRCGFVDQIEMEKRAGKIFDELGIQINLRAKAKDLSVAQMQFVEIAKAVSHDLKILVMDEPTAPLTNQDAEILFKLIGKLKAQGVTILYITHRLSEIYRLADKLTVMRDGKVITTADTADIPQNELIRLMVNRELSEAYPPRSNTPGDVTLQVDALSGPGVEDLSFNLRKGEILGLAGLTGSGRTETVRLLFGADRISGGSITLDGKPVSIKSPKDAVGHGFGFLPENRKDQGVLLGLSIKENIVLPIIRRISEFTFVNRKKENSTVKEFVKSLGIATPSENQLVKYLSGGNQQKVVVSKWLASSSRILIFDEPTVGIDVGARYEIYQMMNSLSGQGLSIIIISSEMEELIGMADRIMVLHEGRMSGVLEERTAFNKEQIMELASAG